MSFDLYMLIQVPRLRSNRKGTHSLRNIINCIPLVISMKIQTATVTTVITIWVNSRLVLSGLRNIRRKKIRTNGSNGNFARGISSLQIIPLIQIQFTLVFYCFKTI
jgi:hypothetical protein